ncbi:formylglycine-generating enzyme family protein [Orenia marismortui]|uniref:formylglycine-generating enzyme family protein n=1 Tax=Orenia marismortui TaxID=46469 RepID=UPI000370D6D5|nr:SUMF1/EgtB/PvdO family nonheme iron enzyme [Orenia marismortui]
MKKGKIIILSLILVVSFSSLIYASQSSFNKSKLVIVEKGQFMMNSSNENFSEQEECNVKVNDFYISKYEVTHKEYIEFLNDRKIGIDGKYNGHRLIDIDDLDCAVGYRNKFYFKSSNKANVEECPVIEVTWWGAIDYCNWLSEKNELKKAYNSDGYLLDKNGNIVTDIRKVEGYRLPTKVEWEYAARGGIKGKDTIYAGSDILDKCAWHWENSKVNNVGQTHPIGEKMANELGIYDMSGNVAEWINTKNDSNMIFMNGSWDDLGIFCEVGFWDYDKPSISEDTLGFRFVRTKAQ